MVLSYVPRGHSPLQVHQNVLLASTDLIPRHRHQAARSVVLGTSLLPVHRVLSVKLAALLLMRDLLSVRDVLLDLSLVLESLVVAYALPDC